MPNKILILVSPAHSSFSIGLPGSEAADINKYISTLETQSQLDHSLLLAPSALSTDEPLNAALSKTKTSSTIAFIKNPEDTAKAQDYLSRIASSRPFGVKAYLAKGSSIFSDTFFQASDIGGKIDSAHRFARDRLGADLALHVWSSLNALVATGLSFLPNSGEAGTGERVVTQLGCDDQYLALSVRFDLAEENWPKAFFHPVLSIPKSSAHYLEVRAQRDSKLVEVVAIFQRNTAPEAGAIECRSIETAGTLEKPDEIKDYQFQSLGKIHGSEVETKRVIKGGFKKKFSETVTVKASPDNKDPNTTAITPESVVDADSGNFLVKGEVLAENKVVISGDNKLKKDSETQVWEGKFKTLQDEIAKRDATIAELKVQANQPKQGATASPGEKASPLLESKIQSLETTLKQRDELVAKLNKEIAEIKDPMKMGVISGIKDNQVEGLKGNLARLQTELAESQAREKELMGVVDKAIQLKDDAIKRFKDIETKLRQSQGGNNSKVVTLEKQLEEQKRQNKELSKRVGQLTEQLQAAGKKVA